MSRVCRLQTVGYRLAIEASWTCLGWPWQYCQGHSTLLLPQPQTLPNLPCRQRHHHPHCVGFDNAAIGLLQLSVRGPAAVDSRAVTESAERRCSASVWLTSSWSCLIVIMSHVITWCNYTGCLPGHWCMPFTTKDVRRISQTLYRLLRQQLLAANFDHLPLRTTSCRVHFPSSASGPSRMQVLAPVRAGLVIASPQT